jgi:kynureninase
LWTQQALRGFALTPVGREQTWLSADEMCAAIDERVAVVALPLVSPRTGALLPLAEVTEHARRMGAITVVDAFQAVGVVDVDVEALRADVVVGGTYKWMCGGGIGVAFMYVRPGVAERLEAVYPGWIGHANLLASTPQFEPAPGALRFQQGTPAMEPIYTARAGLQFLMEVGIDSIRERSLALTQRIIDSLSEYDFRISTPAEPARRSGMVCLDVPGPDAIVNALALESVDVDARPDAGLRIGPFPCMDESECDRLADRIAQLVRQ